MLLLLLACQNQPQTNVIWILTDDQRADTLWAMPELTARLVGEGVRFTDANVTTPLCCPSRASLYSGGYLPAEVGVLTNRAPNGGFKMFTGGPTLAERAREAGYRTGFFGKYLNGSDTLERLTVPAGWEQFTMLRSPFDYNEPRFFEGSAGEEAVPVEPGMYLTDVIADQALTFIQQNDEPYFVTINHFAPHTPIKVNGRDRALHTEYEWRPESFGEDLSDKPAWVHDAQLEVGAEDDTIRDQLQALAAVDRGIGRLLDALAERGDLEHTVVFFFSDNGMSWLEHGMWGKGMPYTPSLMVPLVVRAPGIAPGVHDGLVAANLDVPTTTQILLGLSPRGQGQDLLPMLQGMPSTHSSLPIANFTAVRPYWSGILTEDWKYVEYTTGEEELYDRQTDPDELDGSIDIDAPIDDLRAENEARRALVLIDSAFDVPLGSAFELPLRTWGGTPPLTFSSENLPSGVTLVDDRLGGVLTEPSMVRLTVSVVDSGRSPFTGEPHRFGQTIELYPNAAAGPAQPRYRSDLEGPPERIGDTLLVRRYHPGPTSIEVSPDPDFERDLWTSAELSGAELRFEEVPPGWVRVVGQPGFWCR